MPTSTRGNSLAKAVRNTQSNAAVVIAPPGGGKTVSLRNLAIQKIHTRLSRKSDVIPIFVSLGEYTKHETDDNGNPKYEMDDNGRYEKDDNGNYIKQPLCFDTFLENYFSSHGVYNYLCNYK